MLKIKLTINSNVQVCFCVFQHPEYYNVVTDSVSLNDIKSRASCYGRYRCVSDFIKDLNIVFFNAKLYYSVRANKHVDIIPAHF